MKVRNLTPQQEAAITYSSNMVITACPGSGKTTVVEEKVRNILPTIKAHQGIVAITFTRKASQELKRRCKRNNYDTKQSFFGTIDKFCLEELIYPFLSHLWGKSARECKVVEKLDKEYSELFLHKQTPKIFDIQADEGFKKLYDKGVLWMSSFAGLANFILEGSKSAERYLKAKYTHIFIDEYQDSSKEQHKLFLKLVDLGLIGIAVGDADQSIYEFRGSSVQYLNGLITDKEKFKFFRIDINHRCHPSISNYASRVKNCLAPILPVSYTQCRVHRYTLEGNHRQAAKRISEIITHIVNKTEVLNYSDIAILAKNNKILKEVSEGLLVDYRLYVDIDLEKINTPIARIMYDLLAFYFGKISTMQEVLDNNQIKKYFFEKENLLSLKEKIKGLKGLEEKQLIQSFEEIITEMGLKNFSQELQAVTRILADEILKKLFKPISPTEIQVMTLHKSKGLEFHTVIHVGLEEWVFPYREATHDWSPYYPELEQDTNLHYVGITRAQELCILIQTKKRINSKEEEKNAAPSYFLNLPGLEGLYKQH
ncbi:ATP-dependent helicase [Acinetobacter dispersus]|uniref:UvrD-helicase domain-containing protein n=1 Tax=Acinetobacter dispersus TaxID=70348 RepID=UPI001F4A219A|nr:ATP-dependent helicase [Acinetobacter dispersus]MCH7392725.1 ATP-dependent helicase [Acinetobacter dispersus]